MYRTMSFLAVVLSLAVSRCAFAQNWTETQKLISGDAHQSDEYGWAIDMDGEWAIVGAHLDSNGGQSKNGAAYLLQLVDGTWVEKAKLTDFGFSSHDHDYAGSSVAIDGNRVIVGVPRANGSTSNRGAAAIFEFSEGNWQRIATLRGPNSEKSYFGTSVGIDGDRVVVGAFDGSTRPGAAYIFEKAGDEWQQIARLTASDRASYDEFGTALSLYGETVVVGARARDGAGGGSAGAAYVFKCAGSNWVETAILTPGDLTGTSHFGNAIDFDGERILVGADTHPSNGVYGAGAAYLFESTGGSWNEVARITASEPADTDQFGFSVALDGENVLIGAIQDDEEGRTNCGAAYLFERHASSWEEVARLTAGDGAKNDQFGFNVALDGDWVMAGARQHDLSPEDWNAGAVYVFTPEPSTIFLLATGALGLLAYGWRRRS